MEVPLIYYTGPAGGEGVWQSWQGAPDRIPIAYLQKSWVVPTLCQTVRDRWQCHAPSEKSPENLVQCACRMSNLKEERIPRLNRLTTTPCFPGHCRGIGLHEDSSALRFNAAWPVSLRGLGPWLSGGGPARTGQGNPLQPG